MTRYYFDTWDNDEFIEDDAGLEFADLGAVKDQAAISLAELAREVLPGKLKHALKVEVRDGTRPVLRATLLFEAVPLAD